MLAFIPYMEVFGFLLLGGAVDVFGKNERKKHMLFVFSIILLIGFLGLRGFIGWDWWAYYPSYNNLPNGFNYEIGYEIWSNIFYKIGLSYHHFTFINTVADILILAYVLKKYSKYPIFSMFLFLAVQGLSFEVDLLRNAKAVLLFIISIQFIKERKIIPFLILNILGMTFHMSSVIYLPMYFILNRNYSRKIILPLIILGNIYYLFDTKLFIHILEYMSSVLPAAVGGKITSYLSIIPQNYKLPVGTLYFERLVTFIMVFFFLHKEKNHREKENPYSLIMENSFYIFYLIFLFTSEFFIASTRIGILFIYANWFLWGDIIENLRDTKIKAAVFLIAVLIGGNRIYNHFDFNGNKILYRYENIITDHKPYEEKMKDLGRARKFKDEADGKELLILY
ncbi:EpsG family protein [Fusobacterium sp. SB021]|uniref:EpsG family protein n=1 Tax=Fusobacterium sp. SB021 TaxID=2744227 RepID=UPI003CF79748